MAYRSQPHLYLALGIFAVLGVSYFGSRASAAPEYHPIAPAMQPKTVTLTGHDLTIEQLIDVARHGAQVQYAPGVLQQASKARELKLEADAEGIPVYGVNRGSGSHREVKENEADAAPPAMLNAGMLPEIDDEALVRATIVIGANSVGSAGTTAEEARMLLDLLNKRVTPVAYSRGTLGEADFPAISNNITATIAGQGEAYYKGVRMSAAEALRQAGLKPLAASFFAGGAENAYGDALAALVVADGRRALEWADLIAAMDLLGMNSSLTPMATPVQARRPFKWVSWDAARIMDMVKSSFLFEDDPKRILQDPQSMRSAYIRQGSAWQAWATLRDSVELQINSADLNPIALVGVSPKDSWELATSHFMKYYVKGGALNHGEHGYVFSTANWDPYPLANDIEAFTNAVANMDALIAQITERFTATFFTGIKPEDVLTPEQFKASPWTPDSYVVVMDLWAEIQNESRSITPEGNAADVGVADTEGFTRLKGAHALEAVDLTMQLLAYNLLTATYWMDVRKAQNSSRNFGTAPTAAWTALRKILPWQKTPSQRSQVPYGIVAYEFLKSTPAASFYGAGPIMPESRTQP